jgi:hypothetical protein
MMFLALSFVMFGCEFPTTYIEIPVPVETPAVGGTGTEGGCECEPIDPGESRITHAALKPRKTAVAVQNFRIYRAAVVARMPINHQQ